MLMKWKALCTLIFRNQVDFGAMCGLDESTMLQFASERGGNPKIL